MTRNPLLRRLYALLSGRRAVAHANHRLSDVEVRRRPEDDCPNCNPTARAMRRVRELWVAAGIDKGE